MHLFLKKKQNIELVTTNNCVIKWCIIEIKFKTVNYQLQKTILFTQNDFEFVETKRLIQLFYVHKSITRDNYVTKLVKTESI